MNRKRALILLGIATVAFTFVPYLLLERRIQAAGGPGIIGFEFAGSRSRAAWIMAEWGAKGRQAASFDASENVALLLTLAGRGGSFAPPFATVCSTVKFTLITIAILYVLCGLALPLRQRLQPS